MRICHRIPWVLLFVVILQTSLPVRLSAAKLDDGEFKKLHAMLQPSPDEPWRMIPWQIELLDAQQIAAKEKKPIFIWAMDGHPLGCT
jgi:hypothetical protein